MVTGLLRQETNMAESHDTYVNWLEAENHAFADACESDLAVGVPTSLGTLQSGLMFVQVRGTAEAGRSSVFPTPSHNCRSLPVSDRQRVGGDQ